MKEIKLSQAGKSKGVYVSLVDDEDFEFLNQWSWYVYKHGNTYYAVRDGREFGNKKRVYMHRAIMGLENGDKRVIDHINHNGFDNQRANMRICTNTENIYNRQSNKNSSSEHRGVSLYKGKNFNKTKQEWISRNPRWLAVIGFNNKKIHLGYYATEIEAAMAYNTKAIELYGKFVNLNQIQTKCQNKS